MCTSKNESAQRDAKERPRRSHQTFIFKPFSACFILRHRLGDRPRRALHIEDEQYRNGCIHVFDLIESMLDHRAVTPKSKNERHAAWERFSCFHGPVGCLKEGPPKMPKTIIFSHFRRFFDPTNAEVMHRRRRAL